MESRYGGFPKKINNKKAYNLAVGLVRAQTERKPGLEWEVATENLKELYLSENIHP